MPYVTRHMASFLHEKGLSNCESESSSGGGNRLILRHVPSSQISSTSSRSVVSRTQSSRSKSSKRERSSRTSTKRLVIGSTVSAGEKYEKALHRLTFDEKKLLFILDLLKKSVSRLEATEGAQDWRRSKDWNHYKLDYDSILVSKDKCKLCELVIKCTHRNSEFKDFPLCCKIYPDSRVEPNSLYLRISRLLGRKHPNIIQTWAIFHKENKSLMIHEWFFYGTTENFIEKNGPFREELVVEISVQLAKAMDYLGDMGLSHRALSPRYVFISRREPVIVKLGGFHHSIVYWDFKRATVALVPCIPISQRPSTPDFIAPECYGDSEREAYDPINADIWSFGATIFWMLTRKYPFDYTRENPQLEHEIRENIDSTKKSSKCRKFLKKVLCTDADKRINFDKINTHPWLMQIISSSLLNLR